MNEKPRLSFWQIWNMSFGFLGIQFGFALQNANVSRIFETLGANKDMLPILWIAAPVTGLIIQPIIGHMSDNTWNRFGRRRPYFLVGAIFASLALLVMPNAPFLWVAAGMLWILDASINVSMEPFRAFVGDMLPPEQRTKGFAMQSFFIGIGSVIASALPYVLTNWFDVSNIAPEGVIPDSVKWSFYLGAAVFIFAISWTVFKTREYSPQEMESFNRPRNPDPSSAHAAQKDDPASGNARAMRKLIHGPFFTVAGLLSSLLVWSLGWDEKLYIVTLGIAALGLLLLCAALMQKSGRTNNGLVVVMDDLYSMPKTMKQLSVVQFFSWFALFSMWIYMTNAVTSHHYDMKLTAGDVSAMRGLLGEINETRDADRTAQIRQDLDAFDEEFKSGSQQVVATMRVVTFFVTRFNDEAAPATPVISRLKVIQKEFNTGADWVTVLFSVYNGVAALTAFLLPWLAARTNRRTAHSLALLAGAAGFASVYFFRDPRLLIISMTGVGIAWASILSLPYAILSGCLPSHKMGTYMGIFNFFIVLPQMLAAAILGFFVTTVFGGQTVLALMLGAATWVVAAIITQFVDDADERYFIKGEPMPSSGH